MSILFRSVALEDWMVVLHSLGGSVFLRELAEDEVDVLVVCGAVMCVHLRVHLPWNLFGRGGYDGD
jgi:hypothetical protein